MVWQLNSCSVGQKEHGASVLPSSIKSFRSDKRKNGAEKLYWFLPPTAWMSLPKVITPASSPSGTALLSLVLSSLRALGRISYCQDFKLGKAGQPKTLDTPLLENFKNRKEVCLFSEVYNHRPVKGRKLAKNGILRKFFLLGGP